MEDSSLPDWVANTLIGLYSILAIVGSTGNGELLVSFLLKKRAKTNANCYQIAIAVCDILLVCCSFLLVLSGGLGIKEWVHGGFMCSAWSYIKTACVIQRSLILMAAAFDRLFAVRCPLKKRAMRKAVISRINVSVLVVSLLLSVASVQRTHNVHDFTTANESISRTVHDDYPDSEQRRAFDIAFFLLTYLVPLFVLAITHVLVTQVLAAKPPGEEHALILQRRRTARSRTTKLFLQTFFSLAVCWLPFHTLTLLNDFSLLTEEKYVLNSIMAFARCLTVLNSVITPILLMVERNCQRQTRAQSQRSRGIPIQAKMEYNKIRGMNTTKSLYFREKIGSAGQWSLQSTSWAIQRNMPSTCV